MSIVVAGATTLRGFPPELILATQRHFGILSGSYPLTQEWEFGESSPFVVTQGSCLAIKNIPKDAPFVPFRALYRHLSHFLLAH